ncbi:hypothetical protein Cgig2_029195 [Carnegiea gigantea]|uniref:Protein FAR1-RELATED SEQUENCE n=1 Tax=Carnegiea gigantea TaxID=171969 RepID=A0A9Q1KIH8_9CARY|nr:hypothetical protein Cgig2_029195 [Carnegiea gigantea]
MTESGNQDVESSEHETDLSPENTGSLEEITEDTILSRQTSVNLVPFIGQRFVSQDAAYEFYCSFAKQFGFSIRRHRTRGKDGVGRGVTRRDFTCHRSGFPQAKPTDEGKLQRNRKSSRCGCQAYMRIVKRADFDVPEWRVTGFSNNHNHELLKSAEVCMPAHCPISADDKSRICMFAKAGMSVRQMLRLMELEKGVKLGCLPFTELDIRNLLLSFRHVDRDNDAIDLIGMCKTLKDENPNFKYDYKLDGHNKLEHIAWSYAPSVQQYQAYGDAVVFDTTHRLDAYDMLLGLWIGVDNHGMACLYGCVLLRDENLQSFAWALKVGNIAEYNDQAGAKQKMHQKLQKVCLKTGSPMESHAATILTPYAFSMLQEELVLAPQFASVLIDEGCFHVTHHAQINESCKVTWDTSQQLIRCSCHQFEFVGILCRHILRVLSTNNCFQIPHQYLPTRWHLVGPSATKPLSKQHIEKVQILETLASSVVSESIETEERLHIACEQMSMVLSHIKQLPRLNDHRNDVGFNSPSSLMMPEVEDSGGIVQSYTMGSLHESFSGKLKDRKPNAGVDISRKRRRCSIPCCGQFGHDASDCPIIGSASLHGDGDSLGFL